jgi:WD repeat-containing protein 68
MNQPQQQYQPPRRTGGFSSQHDELHMPASMAHHSQQMAPRDYSSVGAPHIKLEQVSPNVSSLPSYQSGGNVPNVLQPGGMSARPPAISSNTAPTLSGMQQQQPEYHSYQHQGPSKSNSLSISHSHSRSSPSTPYEGGGSSYVPYTPTTPGGTGNSSPFTSPTDMKYNPPNNQRNMSNTPLGLADIRPRADSSLSDGLPGTPGYEVADIRPRTSNYMAPWALYAFDWCKWAPQGNSAGKLAIGSYLEDGHNYVSNPMLPPAQRKHTDRGMLPRYKSSMPSSPRHRQTSMCLADPSGLWTSQGSQRLPMRIL